jgi:hypothetical protein
VPRNGGAVDFATNPDDQSSSIILFATGKCQTTGSAPLPEDTPIFTGYLGDYSPTGGWFGVGSRTAQAVRIQVLEWQTPSGWILDSMGNVHEFGGASRANSLGIKGTPDLSQGNAEGLQMDPNNTGKGYIIDNYGTIFDFGGAPEIPKFIDVIRANLGPTDHILAFEPLSNAQLLDQADIAYTTATDWLRNLSEIMYRSIHGVVAGGWPQLFLNDPLWIKNGVNRPALNGAAPFIWAAITNWGNIAVVLPIRDFAINNDEWPNPKSAVVLGQKQLFLNAPAISYGMNPQLKDETMRPGFTLRRLAVDWHLRTAWASEDWGQIYSTYPFTYEPVGETYLTPLGGGSGAFNILSTNPLRISQLAFSGAIFAFTTSTAPTAKIVAPATAVSDTSRPTMHFEYSDPDNNPMARAEAKLFTEATYTRKGFGPETAQAWKAETKVGPDAREFDTLPDEFHSYDMPSDGKWRWYLKVTDNAGSSSPWVYQEFTMALIPPSTPLLEAQPDTSRATVDLKITAPKATSASYFQIERRQYKNARDIIKAVRFYGGQPQVGPELAQSMATLLNTTASETAQIESMAVDGPAVMRSPLPPNGTLNIIAVGIGDALAGTDPPVFGDWTEAMAAILSVEKVFTTTNTTLWATEGDTATGSGADIGSTDVSFIELNATGAAAIWTIPAGSPYDRTAHIGLLAPRTGEATVTVSRNGSFVEQKQLFGGGHAAQVTVPSTNPGDTIRCEMTATVGGTPGVDWAGLDKKTPLVHVLSPQPLPDYSGPYAMLTDETITAYTAATDVAAANVQVPQTDPAKAIHKESANWKVGPALSAMGSALVADAVMATRDLAEPSELVGYARPVGPTSFYDDFDRLPESLAPPWQQRSGEWRTDGSQLRCTRQRWTTPSVLDTFESYEDNQELVLPWEMDNQWYVTDDKARTDFSDPAYPNIARCNFQQVDVSVTLDISTRTDGCAMVLRYRDQDNYLLMESTATAWLLRQMLNGSLTTLQTFPTTVPASLSAHAEIVGTTLRFWSDLAEITPPGGYVLPEPSGYETWFGFTCTSTTPETARFDKFGMGPPSPEPDTLYALATTNLGLSDGTVSALISAPVEGTGLTTRGKDTYNFLAVVLGANLSDWNLHKVENGVWTLIETVGTSDTSATTNLRLSWTETAITTYVNGTKHQTTVAGEPAGKMAGTVANCPTEPEATRWDNFLHGATPEVPEKSSSFAHRFCEWNKPTTYMARLIQPSPYIASQFGAASVILRRRWAGDWWLHRTDRTDLDRPINKAAELNLSRSIAATVFEPIGRADPVIISDMEPLKSRAGQLTLFAESGEGAKKLMQLLEDITPSTTFAIRTEDSELWFCKLLGSLPWHRKRGRYSDFDVSGVTRDVEVQIQFREVKRPPIDLGPTR